MVEANRSLPHYWMDVILTSAWECRRFDCEREALAYARVYARFRTLKRWWLTRTDPKGGRSSSIAAKQKRRSFMR
jgi:hypothetical protein